MSIETIGSMQKILNGANTKDWAKSSGVDSINNINNWAKDIPDIGSDKVNTASFGEMLSNSLSEVNSLQHQANHAIEKLVTGESKNIHETMLTVEKAEIAFKAMNQVRSKVIAAYQEVMRMQV